MTPASSDPIFESERSRLQGLAYRMVGSWSEAEDLVQEAWLRWHRSRSDVEDPPGWLTTVTARLCLDHLRSARVRREEYVGTWLPEPIATDAGPAADALAERTDRLGFALLSLLEQLTPAERVAFVLREAFDQPYAELGAVLDREEPACRQLVSRARRKLRTGAAGADATSAEATQTETAAIRDRMLATFALAARGDIEPMLGLLDPDAILFSDGGGRVPAAINPIFGADKIGRFFAGVLPKAPPDLRLEARELNGEPALVALACNQKGVQVLQSMHLEVVDGRVRTLFLVRNPDKLSRL